MEDLSAKGHITYKTAWKLHLQKLNGKKRYMSKDQIIPG